MILLGAPFLDGQSLPDVAETRDVENQYEKSNDTLIENKQQAIQPVVTKSELYSYYLYYMGNTGHTMFSYMPTLLQYLSYRGGFDPATPEIKGCDLNDPAVPCHVSFSNSTVSSIPISSMVLYLQATAFFIQFMLFTTFGGLADYGRNARYVLLASTILGCTAQILPVFLIGDDGSHWYVMALFMMLALIGYGASSVFSGAMCPNISDNLPIVRKTRFDIDSTHQEQQSVIGHWRKQISATSYFATFLGILFVTGFLACLSYIPWSQGPFLTSGGNFGDTVLFNHIGTMICGTCWALAAIPYFIVQPKGRRGHPFPNNANYFTYGWKSILFALKDIKQYKYLFLFMVAYFMYNDAISTVDQLMAIVVGPLTHFSTHQLTLMGIVFAVSAIVGNIFFWWLFQRYHFSVKTSILVILVTTCVVPLYGCIGITSLSVGFKTAGELWLFSAWWGFFTSPIWPWQQAMLCQLIPHGKENLFFGLFGVVSRASSWVGPLVIGAIAQHTGNLYIGWTFILGLFLMAILLVCGVDMDGAQINVSDQQHQRLQ